jgi:threonine/homoserine/homoserine lactone efflux protein
MIEDLIAAIPLGFFLAFLIGPVFFILLETAAVKGVRAAIALDLGVIVADIVFIFIAYFSTSQLLQKIKDDPALFIFGGVILVTYGIISLIKNKKNYQLQEDPTIVVIKKNNYIELFIKGFFLNFINIGVLGFWLGIFNCIWTSIGNGYQTHHLFLWSNFSNILCCRYFQNSCCKKTK